MNIPKISPFKLLKPYGQGDLALFFGREEETRRLTEALLQTKFMLLYGASGTGKTSLIQCGLQGKFSPRDWMPIFVRRGQEGFPEAIRQALKEQYEACYAVVYPGSAPPPMEHLSLREWVQALFDIAFVPVYLILDQFEEIFILGTEAEQVAFFETLRDLRLFEEDLFCKLLIITREEYIAHFYRFEAQLPFLFEYRFRVEKMREGQLERVVRKTLEAKYPGYPDFDVDDKVPAQIVQNLGDERKEVDLTTLQVYLDRLYREDLQRVEADGIGRGHICFDLHLIGEHSMENVLSDFLDEQLAKVTERLRTRHATELQQQTGNIPLQVLYSLVTDQGTKRIRSAEESHAILNSKKHLSASFALVEDCFNELAGSDCRILNRLSSAKTGEQYYEIAHDRLAEQVSPKNNAAEMRYREAMTTLANKQKLHEEVSKNSRKQEYLSLGELELVGQTVNLERLELTALRDFYESSQRYHQRRRRRQRWVTVGALAAAVVFGLVALVAVIQTQLAERRQKEAKSAQEQAEANLHKFYEARYIGMIERAETYLVLEESEYALFEYKQAQAFWYDTLYKTQVVPDSLAKYIHQIQNQQ